MNFAQPAFALQAMARQTCKPLKNSPGEDTGPTKPVISQEIV